MQGLAVRGKKGYNIFTVKAVFKYIHHYASAPF